MRRVFAAFTASALVFVSVLAVVPSSAATSDLGIFPEFAARGTVPGRSVQEDLTVVNLSEDDFSITSSLTDLSVDSTGTFFSASAGAGLPSAVAWGRVSPASFVLPRGHTQTVRVVFVPPTSARTQGYYAAVRFDGQSGRGTTTQAVRPFLLEVSGSGVLRAARIASISTPASSFGSTIPVTLQLEASGNVYALAQGRVVVRDEFSRIAGVVQVGRTPVVPGTPRILRVDVPSPAVPGRVRVSAEFAFGPGVPTDTKTATLLAFAWWHFVVAALLLLLLIRLYVVLRRWKHHRALRRRPHVEATLPEKEPAAASVAAAAGSVRTSVGSAEAASPPRAAVETEDLQSSWDAPAEPRVPEKIHARPAQPVRPASPEDEDLALWPEPRVLPRTPAPAEERPERPLLLPPSPEPLFKPAEEVPAAVEPELEPGRDPEPVAIEPEPEPASIARVEAPTAIEPPPAPVVEAEVEEVAPAAARAARLSEQIKAAISEDAAGGPQANERRVRVAIELLAAGSGRSLERVDVALKILASVGADSAHEVETAFDEAVEGRRTGAYGTFALALAKLESPRAPEALLRAYAVAQRGQLTALKAALRACDRASLRLHPALLKALPADRRAALKLD